MIYDKAAGENIKRTIFIARHWIFVTFGLVILLNLKVNVLLNCADCISRKKFHMISARFFERLPLWTHCIKWLDYHFVLKIDSNFTSHTHTHTHTHTIWWHIWIDPQPVLCFFSWEKVRRDKIVSIKQNAEGCKWFKQNAGESGWKFSVREKVQ